jgi:hypothetical protein
VTVRSETDSALAIAFLDDDLERLRGRSEAVLSRLEEAGEARILSSTRQIFAWTEGEFRELEHERDYDDAPEASQNLVGSPMGRRGGHTTEVSRDYDDVLDRDALLEEFGRRPVRRNMRLPVRK